MMWETEYWLPKDVHTPIPEIFEYITFTWQKGLCGCDQGSQGGEMILDYVDGPSVITM